MQMLVANSLKTHPRWKALFAHLVSVNDGDIQVVDTADFDILLKASSSKHVRYLLLEVNDLPSQYSYLDSWLRRPCNIQRIVMLIGHEDGTSHFQALQELQLHLLDTGALVTVLPLTNFEQVKLHIDQIQITTQSVRPPCDTVGHHSSETVISQATTLNRPFTLHETHRIQELCGSLEGLEKATRFESGRQQLENILGSDKAQSLFTFWEDEWLAR